MLREDDEASGQITRCMISQHQMGMRKAVLVEALGATARLHCTKFTILLHVNPGELRILPQARSHRLTRHSPRPASSAERSIPTDRLIAARHDVVGLAESQSFPQMLLHGEIAYTV